MFLIGLTLQIAIALVCAFHRNRWVDRLIVVSSVAVMSIPYMVWIIIGQYGLGYHFRIFPIWGYESPGYLVLPCLIGISSGLGSGIRFYRAIMLDEVNRDYVRTAVAKGVGRSGVLFRHVLKNAMIPILTSVVVAIPFLYTGSLLLESFFGIPGLGNMAINGLYSSDYDVIRSIVFIGAVLYMVSSLVTDILYTVVDPRVRVQ
jgi:peptide/nickel transport system permease protein